MKKSIFKRLVLMICIFDCETIPDVELVKKEFGVNGSDLEVMQQAFEIQEKKSGSSFLPIAFHRVVTISAVITDDNFNFLKVGSFPKDLINIDEVDILKNFLGFIDSKKPKLVSFNGNGFDLPMLFLRAMKYNLSCKSFFDSDKWEGYRSRYSEKKNLDLLDSIKHFGAVKGLKLDTICSMSGVPGKFDVSGNQVHELFCEDKLNEIIDYCESDVLNTYWVMLKYEILKGNLNLIDYKNILQDFLNKLPQNKSYSEIFTDFLNREINNL